jgi:hypothetical protein
MVSWFQGWVTGLQVEILCKKIIILVFGMDLGHGSLHHDVGDLEST